LADLIAFVLLIAGVERFRPVAGAATNRMAGEIPFSHSLLMDAVWAVLFALAFYLWRQSRTGACLLFAAAISHWVLDVVSHRPDMAVVPGAGPLLGLGLWNSISATVVVEGGMWIAAIVIYLRATKRANWAGGVIFWIGVLLFTVSWLANVRAGVAPNPVRAGINGLVFFSLVIAWGYWMNRARYFKTSSK
jgi:membrane-bound metal-dependent hydrolase YbcI (DUF457 family)